MLDVLKNRSALENLKILDVFKFDPKFRSGRGELGNFLTYSFDFNMYCCFLSLMDYRCSSTVRFDLKRIVKMKAPYMYEYQY